MADYKKKRAIEKGNLPRALTTARLNAVLATTYATARFSCRMEPKGIEPSTSALRTQQPNRQGIVIALTYGAAVISGCRWGRALNHGTAARSHLPPVPEVEAASGIVGESHPSAKKSKVKHRFRANPTGTLSGKSSSFPDKELPQTDAGQGYAPMWVRRVC